MSLKRIQCPSCQKKVPFDTDFGDEQHCPSCGGMIRLVMRQKKTRRRAGVRFGDKVYGVSSSDEEAGEEIAEEESRGPAPRSESSSRRRSSGRRSQRRRGIRFGSEVYGVDSTRSSREEDPVSEKPSFAEQKKPEPIIEDEGDEELDYIVPEDEEMDFVEEEVAAPSRKKKRRKKSAGWKSSSSRGSGKDDGTASRTSSRYRRRQVFWALGIFLILASAVGLVTFLKDSGEDGSVTTSTAATTRGVLAQERRTIPTDVGAQLEEERRAAGLETPLEISDRLVEVRNREMNPFKDLPPEDIPHRRRENAMEAAQAFLDAKNLEERIRTVRDPLKTGPMMARYYEGRYDGPIQYNGLSLLVAEDNNPDYIAVQVALKGEGPRMIGIERVGKEYFVDWGSFALMSEMDWDELLERKPSSPILLRAFVSRDDYFNYEFKAGGKWVCLKLQDPHGLEPTIYSYAEAVSPAMENLEKLFEINSQRPLPLIVRVRFTPGSKSPNQVVLHEVVSNGWMLRDEVNWIGADRSKDLDR